MALLEIDNLTIAFAQEDGMFRRRETQVVHGIGLTADEGEVVAIVGASGAGKSLLAHAILGILPGNAVMTGSMRYRGAPLDAAAQAALRGREIALVPQSVGYLDPLMRVGRQVRATADGYRPEAERRRVFERLRLPERAARLFPHQLSGGMARKALVATAAIGGARLIVADEPTPGMPPEDVAEALRQLRELADGGCAALLITHDIAAALRVADRVAVLYGGTVVEIAHAADFGEDGRGLRHPYTQALWRALPQNGFTAPQRLRAADADAAPAAGCGFAAYCRAASAACGERLPEPTELRGGTVRCFHAS